MNKKFLSILVVTAMVLSLVVPLGKMVKAADTGAVNPSSCSGNWTYGSRGYTSNNSYAYDSSNGDSETYSGYGFSLGTSTITKVEVGIEAYTKTNNGLQLRVSWNGGGTYSGWSSTYYPPGSDPNSVMWFDFTSSTSWMPTKLNNANFRVQIRYVKNYYQNDCIDYNIYLDWIPVRVTYTEVANTYALTMTANPTIGGTATDVTNASPYAAGTSVSISASAATGYHFVNWTAPAGSFGDANNSSTTFTMPAQAVTVTANFAIDTFTVTFNSEGGSAVAPLTGIAYGGTITAPADPAYTGHTFAGWYKEDTYINPWVFSSDTVTSDITLYAKWTINQYTITAWAGIGGSIAPTGITTVAYDGSQSFTITPDTDYHILAVLVDGSSVGAVSYYEFDNVTDNHTIDAYFEHKYFKTTYPLDDVDTEIFAPTDTIHVTWDVEGFIGTEGKVRVLFYDGINWTIVASNLDLADGSYDLNLTGMTIVDPLRCRVRAGIYDPATGNWLTWGTGKQYYDESGHFWVVSSLPTVYIKHTYPIGDEVFNPTDTIHVAWNVEGFTGTEGKVRVLFYDGLNWTIVASNLDLADGSYDLNLTGITIVDELRVRVRVGIYDPATNAWLTWGTGKQYYDESGHFWVLPHQYPPV